MSVEVLIPFNNNPARVSQYQTVRNHLEGLPWPVSTVHGSEPYRKGASLNDAVAASEAEIVVLNDADSLCPLEQIALAVLQANTEPGLVFAYTRYVRLGQDGNRERVFGETNRALSGVTSIDSHACIAISRDCFLELGGYDESFIGWGPEDADFNRRAAARWPLRRIEGEVVHLWHGDRRPDDSPLDSDPAAVEANRARLKVA